MDDLLMASHHMVSLPMEAINVRKEPQFHWLSSVRIQTIVLHQLLMETLMDNQDLHMEMD